jgi:hypothetical protein
MGNWELGIGIEIGIEIGIGIGIGYWQLQATKK